MVLLYKDREENLTIAVSVQTHEDRIASLKETIQSRDQLIESLKKEVMALKVIYIFTCETNSKFFS